MGQKDKLIEHLKSKPKDFTFEEAYVAPEQPEEFPTMPVQSSIQMLKPPEPSTSFEKFNFDKGVNWDD